MVRLSGYIESITWPTFTFYVVTYPPVWQLWIGANLQADGWTWVNGHPVDLDDQHLNLSHDEGENCLDFLVGAQPTGSWNDMNCSSLEEFVCEKPFRGRSLFILKVKVKLIPTLQIHRRLTTHGWD